MFRSQLRRIRRAARGLRSRKTERLPKVVSLQEFSAAGVSFEISTSAERYRVLEYAGEKEYLGEMLRYLRADDVLYDIGANVGVVALHAAQICDVVAFEPDPSFRARLERNVALNPGTQVRVLPYAASDGDGDVVLYTDGAEGNSPSLRHQRGEKDAVTIPGRTIDSLVASGTLPPPTILKIDIEGAELLALRGANGLLGSTGRPRALFIEIHPQFLAAFDGSSEQVEALLRAAGYTRVVYAASRAHETHLILEVE